MWWKKNQKTNTNKPPEDVKKDKGWQHYLKLTAEEEENQKKLPPYWNKLIQKEKVRWVKTFISKELQKEYFNYDL